MIHLRIEIQNMCPILLRTLKAHACAAAQTTMAADPLLSYFPSRILRVSTPLEAQHERSVQNRGCSTTLLPSRFFIGGEADEVRESGRERRLR